MEQLDPLKRPESKKGSGILNVPQRQKVADKEKENDSFLLWYIKKSSVTKFPDANQGR